MLTQHDVQSAACDRSNQGESQKRVRGPNPMRQAEAPQHHRQNDGDNQTDEKFSQGFPFLSKIRCSEQ